MMQKAAEGELCLELTHWTIMGTGKVPAGQRLVENGLNGTVPEGWKGPLAGICILLA